MDKARITRFITPSTFFLASLFFGAWFDNPCWLKEFKGLPPESVAMIAGAIATTLFPLGFIITAVFTMSLRSIFFLISKATKKQLTYQILLSKKAWEKVWKALKLKNDVKKTRANRLYAAITFDHGMLNEGVHAAAVRLWNAFNIAGASCTALVLAPFVGRCLFKIRLTRNWIGLTGCLFMLFLSVAVVIWKEHMGLIEFQTHNDLRRQNPSQNEE